MGREIHQDLSARRITQLFLDLRRMPVVRHAISLDIFIHFTVQIRHLSSPAGSRCSAFCIDNQRVRIDHAFFYKRISRQNGAGRIAARVGHQSGLFHILPVDLAQPVHRLIYVLRRSVLDPVPFLIDRYAFDPEISTQVYDLHLR